MAIDPTKNVSTPVVRNDAPEADDFAVVARVLPGPAINVTIAEDQPNTAIPTRVAQSIVSTQLVAAEVIPPGNSPTRKTVSIYNDSDAVLYVLLGPGAASAINFTVALNPTDFYETAWPSFTGEINGVWDGAGAGAAQVTVESKV